MSRRALAARRALLADERGQVGGIEAVVFGLLVFVVGTLIVANAWAVVDAKHAVTVAVREAGRAYVEAPDAGTAATAAHRAATSAFADRGRDAARLGLTSTGDGFARCARVTFEATYDVPVVVVPWIATTSGGFTVAARHSELVDPYRSGDGLGAGTC